MKWKRGWAAKPHHRVVDRRKAIALALSLAREGAGDTILLAGKGHETYQVIGTEKQPFDERAIVRELGAGVTLLDQRASRRGSRVPTSPVVRRVSP